MGVEVLYPPGLDNDLQRATGPTCLSNLAAEDVAAVEGGHVLAVACIRIIIQFRLTEAHHCVSRVHSRCHSSRRELPLLQKAFRLEIDTAVYVLPYTDDKVVECGLSVSEAI